MQSTSCEMLCWVKHKLDSRLEGEISITSDTQTVLPLWQKLKGNERAHWWRWKKRMKKKKKGRKWSRSVVSDSLWPHGLTRLLRPWDFPSKSTKVGSHFLFQRIVQTQRSNLVSQMQAATLPSESPRKPKNEKAGLKLNLQKTKRMSSGLITSWQIDGERLETVIDFVFLGSTADNDCSREIQRRLLLGRKPGREY